MEFEDLIKEYKKIRQLRSKRKEILKVYSDQFSLHKENNMPFFSLEYLKKTILKF